MNVLMYIFVEEGKCYSHVYLVKCTVSVSKSGSSAQYGYCCEPTPHGGVAEGSQFEVADSIAETERL